MIVRTLQSSGVECVRADPNLAFEYQLLTSESSASHKSESAKWFVAAQVDYGCSFTREPRARADVLGRC